MDLGLNHRKLARHLGVSRSSVENWGTNETEPARWLLPRINEFLGLPSPQAPLSLAERLTAHRRTLGLSQAAFARSLGVHRCKIGRAHV